MIRMEYSYFLASWSMSKVDIMEYSYVLTAVSKSMNLVFILNKDSTDYFPKYFLLIDYLSFYIQLIVFFFFNLNLHTWLLIDKGFGFEGFIN